MRKPCFVKIEERVSPSSIVLLIDFKEVYSGTGAGSSLKIFIKGWYREKENIRNIKNTKTKNFFCPRNLPL